MMCDKKRKLPIPICFIEKMAYCAFSKMHGLDASEINDQFPFSFELMEYENLGDNYHQFVFVITTCCGEYVTPKIQFFGKIHFLDSDHEDQAKSGMVEIELENDECFKKLFCQEME